MASQTRRISGIQGLPLKTGRDGARQKGFTGLSIRAAGRKTNSQSSEPPSPGTFWAATKKERTIVSVQYQLVLQYQGRDVDDVEDLIHLEDTLNIHLNERHLVEGHDVGDDTMNILIRNDSPGSAVDKIKALLHHSLLDKTKAACRRSGETDFTVMWPEKYEVRCQL
jgi:hypothetical protein